MPTKRVIAINGSHRAGKNTALMLEQVLAELKAGGVETELIELSEYNIKPCASCNRCMRKPQCAIDDDDMAALGEKLLAADAIVLGSPVYWANVTALMKNFMDRSRYFHMTANVLAGKIGAAVTHAALRNGGQEMCAMIMERYLLAQGLVIADCRDPQAPGVISAGAMGMMYSGFDGQQAGWFRSVAEDELAISSSRQLGRNILNMLNNS